MKSDNIVTLAKEVAGRGASGDEKFVVLKTYDNEILATFDLGVLRENSITCCLNGTEFRGVSGLGSLSYLKNIADITLVVAQSDLLKAGEILDLHPTTPTQERKLTPKELLKSIWKALSL